MSFKPKSMKNCRKVDKKKKVSFLGLFGYASTRDKIFIGAGIFCSILSGLPLPINLIVFQNIVNSFTTAGSVVDSMKELYPYYLILGSICLVVSFTQMFCLTLSAKTQAERIRLLLFRYILRQDVGWFDGQSTGNLITQLSNGVDQIESGIGDRLGNFIKNVVTFLASVIIGLAYGWKLALVSLSLIPVIVCAFFVLAFALRKYSVKEIKAYEVAGSIASEVISAIRTVFAFGNQKKEVARYEKELQKSANTFVHKAIFIGIGVGLVSLGLFSTAALTFWYGIELIIKENYDNGTVVLVVLSFIIGSTSLGSALPEVEYFASAVQSAAQLFTIIERVPDIDVDGRGESLTNLLGEIVFHDVSFHYPSRPDVPILKHFSLVIKPGETVAIVGPSGSGKSTTVQLLQRFYDPVEGHITLDGVDLRNLSVPWLRRQIGIVSQEPILFAGTVEDNIALGDLNASSEEIEAASRQADAHGFVVQLPQAYQTELTAGVGKMSGGQKQRLAIARALLRDPKILLLDEATSALDNKSERAIQSAIDRARTSRTVVMIAHRLTTVKNADRIVVVDRGMVKEMGTHTELLEFNGIYASMLSKQGKGDETEVDKMEDEMDDELEDILPSYDGPLIAGVPTGVTRRSTVWRASNLSEVKSVLTDNASASTHHEFQVKHTILEALRLNKPEWLILLIGMVLALAGGLALPGFALLYSEMYEVFSMIMNPGEMRSQTQFICGMLFLLGILRFLVGVFGNWALGVAGARLTKRARRMFFDAILKQEIAWFDRPENQPGVLTARLAVEVQSLQLVTGTQLSLVLEGVTLVVASLVTAFFYSWKLALLNLAFFPLLMIGGVLQARQLREVGTGIVVKGAEIAQEAFSAARTIASLGLEPYFYNKFLKASSCEAKQTLKDSILFALINSLANSTFFFQVAAFFTVAATLYDAKEVSLTGVFRVFASINFAAQGLGRTASLAPDLKKASGNVRQTLATINRRSQMDVDSGLFPETPFRGNIEFRNIHFRYPTRRKIRILRSFTHTVKPETSVAFVGLSGCGKSTLLQLVQRLYDVEQRNADSGIYLDGINVCELAPNWIRDHTGVVSQEPNLFNLSIGENIAYGLNKRSATMDEIVEAARQANIHQFIESLPNGYDTQVGMGGSQLSGGQKQRIAIARALIRAPRLLLLDEATSALDVESERIVQATLDAAMRAGGRTSLVVAHRLTTVEQCDSIVVLANGQKIETGTPSELMQAKGAYFALHNVDAAVTDTQ